MGIHFLRGNAQSPKGHAIFIARSTRDTRVVYSTYCLVPPIPMSIAKYLPPLFAAQISSEELQGASSIAGMPIPPMLEEGIGLEQLEILAERREDDLCDIGTVSYEEVERMQLATISCQEYAQLYATYIAQEEQGSPRTSAAKLKPAQLDDMDAEELLIQTMSDRQKLVELGKLIGMTRYALSGQDTSLLKETQQKMERITRHLPEKYRGSEIITSAINSQKHGTRLAELYLSRAYKLLDEEYADIPDIEREIRNLQA